MIIGISGQAGSGKDTIADWLVADHGFVKVAFADPFKRFCKEIFDFSDDQLWGSSEHRNGIDRRYPRKAVDMSHALTEAGKAALHEQGGLDASGRVIQYLTPRYALQTLGTEWGRDCYPDIWVEYALRVAGKLLDPWFHKPPVIGYSAKEGITTGKRIKPPCGVAIPDVRFRNEIAAIRKAGGLVVRVVCTQLEGSAAAHVSEAEMRDMPDDLFDVVIDNRPGKLTIDQLRREAAALVTSRPRRP